MAAYDEDIWSKGSTVYDALLDKNRYNQDLVDLIRQANQSSIKDPDIKISIVVKKLAKKLKQIKTEFDELTKQEEFAKNPLHFLFTCDDDLTEMQDWCFDNDLLCKVKFVSIMEYDIQAIIFKTEEDATAFKLRWI